MKKRFTIKKWCYFISLFSFLLLFIYANQIVGLFVEGNVMLMKADINNYKKDRIFFSIDSIRFRDDLLGKIDILGWAFGETEKDNSEKEIWLIFKEDGRDYLYKYKANFIYYRPDVYNAYRENTRVRGVYHGLKCSLSTVSMKNGIYNLYVYCKENNENYGVIDTGIKIKKDAGKIYKYTWNSAPQSVIETQATEKNNRSTIDSVSITDEGCLKIVGWAFIDGLETADQSVYVRLLSEDGTTATYNTQSVSRPDVGKAYKNDIYNESGFKAVIPIDMLPAGDIKIEILVENDGNIYKAQKLYIYSPDP